MPSQRGSCTAWRGLVGEQGQPPDVNDTGPSRSSRDDALHGGVHATNTHGRRTLFLSIGDF